MIIYLGALRDMLSEAVQAVEDGAAARTLTRYERERTDYVADMLRDLISAMDEAIEDIEFHGERV